ncbi:MAG: multicopper oxidase domain-containing protein, partial [Caldilinea sp.]|nr:multicopper oxidase domain-containing protein [Caldilinea sp.]
GTATMPDGVSVPVWGYVLGDCTAAPTVSQPGGPVLEVNQGDTVVVTLYNSLPEATGLLFHGQSMPPDRTGAALIGSTTYTFVAEEAG